MMCTGITKETFPGFVKISWLYFLLCLRLAGRAQKNVNKLTQSGKVSLVIPCTGFGQKGSLQVARIFYL